MKTREWTQCALAAACIAICSWIAIPMSVPFTLQTFAVFLICIWLGGRSGCISVLLYLLLGAIGLPVFSGFRGLACCFQRPAATSAAFCSARCCSG